MKQTQLINLIKNRKWTIQSAKAAFLAADMVFVAYANSKTFHKQEYGPCFCYFSGANNQYSQMLDNDQENNVAKKVYLDYLKNQKSLDKRIKEHKNLTKQIDNIWKDYQKKKNNLSNKELLNIYKNLTNTCKKWWYYGVIGEDKGRVIELEIIPKLEKKYNLEKSEAIKLISTLSHPGEQSVLNHEREEFLKLCFDVLSKKSNKLINKKIKEYIKNYFWIKTDFYQINEILTPENVLKHIKNEISKKNIYQISKELKKINNNFEDIHKQKQKLKSQFKLSKKDILDINFAEKTSSWIDWRKFGTMVQLYYLFSILREIAKRFDLTYEELTRYTIDEVNELMQKRKYLDKETTKKRRKNFVVVYEKNKRQFFYGSKGTEIFKIGSNVKELTELKGVVASAGKTDKIQGKVRIVLDPSKEKFDYGEILVITMTRIEFVPLMRKAKAIITNEGGIACHAAIVSRELGIPCIIGTKNATKFLKDDDLIEVDMKKGTIKRL